MVPNSGVGTPCASWRDASRVKYEACNTQACRISKEHRIFGDNAPSGKVPHAYTIDIVKAEGKGEAIHDAIFNHY